MLSKKAQHYSIDMMIASSIFIILFLFVSSSWEKTASNMISTDKRTLLEATTKHSFDSLIYNQGEPTNWQTTSSFETIGIADQKKGYLNEKKIIELYLRNSSSYDKYKNTTGMIGPRYEFLLHINIYDKDFNGLNNYSIGYTGNCTEVSAKNRMFPTSNQKYVLLRYLGCIK